MQKHTTQLHGNHPSWAIRLTALASVLLLLVLSLVQVTHNHTQQSPEDSCPVCVAMHSAAPAAFVTPSVAQVWQRAELPLPPTRLIAHTWHPALYNRPPPAQA